MQDLAVRRVIAECFRATGKDARLLQDLDSLIKKKTHGAAGWAVRAMLDVKKLKTAIDDLSNAIKAPNPDPEVNQVVQEFIHGYFDAWHLLSEGERSKAAERIADQVAPLVLQRLADVAAPLVATTTLTALCKPLLTVSTIQQALKQAARKVEGRPAPRSDAAKDAYEGFLAYLDAYLSAWHGVPATKREKAVSTLLDSLAPGLIDKAAGLIWEHRHQLLAVDELVASDGFKKLLDHLASQAITRADILETKATNLLEQQLGSQGADAFVTLLRARTQEKLDWIKVNGTVYGFLFGATVGVITGLVEHIKLFVSPG